MPKYLPGWFLVRCWWARQLWRRSIVWRMCKMCPCCLNVLFCQCDEHSPQCLRGNRSWSRTWRHQHLVLFGGRREEMLANTKRSWFNLPNRMIYWEKTQKHQPMQYESTGETILKEPSRLMFKENYWQVSQIKEINRVERWTRREGPRTQMKASGKITSRCHVSDVCCHYCTICSGNLVMKNDDVDESHPDGTWLTLCKPQKLGWEVDAAASSVDIELFAFTRHLNVYLEDDGSVRWINASWKFLLHVSKLSDETHLTVGAETTQSSLLTCFSKLSTFSFISFGEGLSYTFSKHDDDAFAIIPVSSASWIRLSAHNISRQLLNSTNSCSCVGLHLIITIGDPQAVRVYAGLASSLLPPQINMMTTDHWTESLP